MKIGWLENGKGRNKGKAYIGWLVFGKEARNGN